jgi:hypothetical protein
MFAKNKFSSPQRPVSQEDLKSSANMNLCSRLPKITNQETWWVLLPKKTDVKISRYCPFGSSQDLPCLASIEKANHNLKY